MLIIQLNLTAPDAQAISVKLGVKTLMRDDALQSTQMSEAAAARIAANGYPRIYAPNRGWRTVLIGLEVAGVIGGALGAWQVGRATRRS